MDLDWVSGVAGGGTARRGARLQSLWGGYGEMLRVEIVGGDVESVIVKCVKPPARAKNEVSDARRRRSYEVERVFYESFAPRVSVAHPSWMRPRRATTMTAHQHGALLLVVRVGGRL